MRKIANIKHPKDAIKRLMVYSCDEGVLVFLFDKECDAACVSDEWYSTVAEAEGFCEHCYNISSSDWELIDDPKLQCQHDWIAPTKVRRDENGKPLWGQFEPA